MSKRTLHDTFESLRDLEVNYDIRDISTEYLKVTNEIDIENYLDYSDKHLEYIKKCERKYKDPKKQPGIFHVILSVKVNKESSRFVPFFSIYSNSGNGLVTPDERDKLFSLGQREIQYDLATFMSTFFRGFNKDYGCGKDLEVPCCAFTVDSSKGVDKKTVRITDMRFLSEFGQSNWITSIDEKYDDSKQKTKRKKVVDAEVITLNSLNGKGKKIAIDSLKEVLFSEGYTSFVKSFSKYYKGKGANILRYTIYNMDFDFGEKADCLTRLLIISTEAGEVSNFMLCQLNKIREIVSFIRSRYAFDLIQKNRYEAIKSAKAAIMARNLSHNLGSHVMFYIKQRLESVSEILQTGALENLIKAKKTDEIANKIAEHGNEMPFLVGLGRFLNYLQERQDFIATVATNHIPYSTLVNFKDAIYDELKPDIRAKRHQKDTSTIGRYPANLLLDYIAKSEGFGSSSRIELKFGDNFSGGETPEDVPVSLREFNISLPGGNLGRQAVFSVMENIIRNTSKHDGREALDGKLIFQFDKIPAENINSIDGYSLRLGENKSQRLDTTCYKRSENDYYYLGITVFLNGTVSNETINNISDGLQQDYITVEGLMDENCKGLKEIRISSAWMRGKELDNRIPRDEPPAVAVRKTNGNLQYIICLPKPKRVAFVSITKSEDMAQKTIEETIKNKEINSALDENGCQVFKIVSFEKWKSKIADFDLIVCSEAEFEQVRPYVGSRILKTKDVHSEVNSYEVAKQDYRKLKNECDELVKALEDCDNDSDNHKKEELKKKCEDLKKNNPIENFISTLYLQWLNKEFEDESGVKLSVLDHKVSNNIETVLPNNLILIGNSDDTLPRYYSNNVIFNTHYQGQANIATNKELFAQARFVEAVSGGNSTDRLIRHDKRDAAWYCSHMAAGLSQVAVFDERLYSQIMPQEEFHLIEAEKCFDENYSGEASFSLLMNASQNMFHLDLKDCDDLFQSLKDIKIESEMKEVYIDKLRHFNRIRNYDKTWQYREKCIWAFNLRINPDQPKTIEVLGYNAAPNSGQIGFYDQYGCETVIALICLENKKPSVQLKDKAFENKFDFISIHQGLLDKIYGVLGIDEDCKKEEVTKALFDRFSKSAGQEIELNQDSDECKYYFLPKFIIHSGRSKPNHKDMPQHLPFLQFSAIDHAVRDCKHTLTELLYSAHYEQED